MGYPKRDKKPVDKRIKSGQYQKIKQSNKLSLPIGVSDYCLASTEYYYIDKTMILKDFIDERPLVTLFTRPRRFGKTLNMDMFRTFFEKSKKDTSIYFQNKKYGDVAENIEIIREKNRNEVQLKKPSDTILKQIIDKKYDSELVSSGIKTIYKYGVAFSEKTLRYA